jgi:hypothetical protein
MNNKIQLYNQKGGVPMLIAAIGQWIGTVVMTVLNGIKDSSIAAFSIYPMNGFTNFNDYYVGAFYQFLFFCVKSSFFILLFVIGGPLLMAIGLIYIYKNLIDKLKQKSDYEDEKAKQKEQETGNAAMN